MRVAIVDLLTATYAYDRLLAEAVARLVDDVTLCVGRPILAPQHFKGLTCKYYPGIAGLLAQAGIPGATSSRARNQSYWLDWVYLSARLWRRTNSVLHIQWLPKIKRSDAELGFIRRIQRSGVAVVHTVHNILPHDFDGSPLVRERYARVYRLADALITNTACDQEVLIEQFAIPRSQVFQVGLGPLHGTTLPTPQDRSRARASRHWEEAWFCFLMLGLIRPYKGVEEALRALPAVVARHPQARLVIAGRCQPEYLSALRGLAQELGIGEQVIWNTGYVPDDQVPGLHAACDVALLPYRAVSQSAALLTAAGLGACVLAAKVGGLAEVVQDGETGLVWDTGDPSDLAKQMLRAIALSQAERMRLGLALRAAVLRDLGWDHLAARTVRAYEWALARRRQLEIARKH